MERGELTEVVNPNGSTFQNRAGKRAAVTTARYITPSWAADPSAESKCKESKANGNRSTDVSRESISRRRLALKNHSKQPKRDRAELAYAKRTARLIDGRIQTVVIGF